MKCAPPWPGKFFVPVPRAGFRLARSPLVVIPRKVPQTIEERGFSSALSDEACFCNGDSSFGEFFALTTQARPATTDQVASFVKGTGTRPPHSPKGFQLFWAHGRLRKARGPFQILAGRTGSPQTPPPAERGEPPGWANWPRGDAFTGPTPVFGAARACSKQKRVGCGCPPRTFTHAGKSLKWSRGPITHKGSPPPPPPPQRGPGYPGLVSRKGSALTAIHSPVLPPACHSAPKAVEPPFRLSFCARPRIGRDHAGF